MEIGSLVTARSTDFNLTAAKTPSDGVVIGHGLIDGNLVFIYSQDASVLNGTIGEMHAKKIASVYDMAMKMGAPVIGLIDCGGIRLQESVDALDGFGTIYAKEVAASGLVPQICRCSHCRDERRLRAERDSRHYAKASSCGNGIKMRCLCSL